jgi:hypothetical protein
MRRWTRNTRPGKPRGVTSSPNDRPPTSRPSRLSPARPGGSYPTPPGSNRNPRWTISSRPYAVQLPQARSSPRL